MPDVILHNRIGVVVLSELQPDVFWYVNRDAFEIGLLGPDPHIYYRFFAPHFHHGINRRSFLMHNTKTGDYLIELARNTNSDEKFSYLAGFLCHYSLDATCHPLVNELANYDDNIHRAIEHRLDLKEIEKQGLRLQERPINRVLPPFPDQQISIYIGNAMKDIFGWDDAIKKFKTSYRHMKMFYWIIQDPYGIFDFLVRRTNGKAKWLSYRSHACDEMDLGRFEELFNRAVDDAIIYINGAYRFYKGKITEQELEMIIGNRSYVTGKEV